MPRHLQLFFLLWLSGFIPSVSGAVDYLCRFPAGDQVTIAGVATDQSGNSYVCGYTARPLSFPETIRIGVSNVAEGQGDAFLIKLGVDGARLATVVFGGEGSDVAQKIAVDPSGNVIVLGYTTSQSFPVLNALQSSLSGSSDIFITKFDSTGTNVIFSTYLGGRGYESPSALGTDGQGEILLAGSTGSDDFLAGPDPFPWRDFPSVAFLAKLSGDGSQLRFAQRFGGSSYDAITGMAVNQEGHAILTGNTWSPDFPTLNALQPTPHASGNSSPFVTRIAPDGATVFSTFLRGDYVDDAQSIAVNAAGEIFVGGSTQSGKFPVYGSESITISTNTVSRLLVVKLNAAGTTVLATNFYRFSSSDRLVALGTAPEDRVLAAGTIYGHIGVPFFALLDANGLSSTVTAGRSGCEPAAGTDAMAFDAFGNLMVAGRELGAAYPAIDSYVARHGTNDWQQPAPPQVTVLSPQSGMTVAAHQPYFIEAAVTGGTGEVTFVKFYNGRRLIGSATNAPFGVPWKNPTRGRHRLTAVANIDGRAVTSCVVNVTAASPRNDAFPGRVLLKSESVEVMGDTTAATGEGLEPWTPTVWYSWRAPSDGLFQIAVSNPKQPFYTLHKVTVFTGTRLKNLAMVGGSYTPSVAIRVRRGEVFRIRVSGYTSVDGEFQLRIRRMTPPVNDDFANATMLAGESLSTPVTMRDAVSEPGEYYWQFDRHYTGEPTVWFAWTAPRSGLFLASATGPGYVPAIYSSTGSTVSNVSSFGQSISGETNGTAFYAEEGTRYYLRLSGENTNDLTLHIAPHTPPLNDHFADRFVIPFGLNSVTGTMIGATGETGEPGGFFPSVTSVWWTWTAPTTGVYRVRADTLLPTFTAPAGTPAPGGAYSSQVIHVFRGDYLSQLAPLPSAVAAFPYTRGDFIFQAVEGTSYQIYLQGGGARYALEVLPVPIPANDNFDDAIALSGVPVVTFGTTYAAFYEPGERGRGYPPPGYLNTDSVWYRWVAPSNGIFAFSVDTANFLEIYEGETLYNASLLAGDDQRHVIQVNGGVEYRLAVISGRRFKLSIQPAQRPANDDFSNRQPLSGLNVHISGDARDASSEPDEPFFYPSFTPARRSLWYSWTAPTNGTFRLISLNNFDSTRLSVFTGEVLAYLARVAAGGSYWGIEFAATNGGTYQISVDPAAQSAQFKLELRYLPPPSNDNFANRLRLTGKQVSLTASNTGASLEIGEPLNASGTAGRTVWWTWRAPRTGRVLFDVGYAGKTLGVYTGDSLAGLTPLMNSRWSESIYNLPVRAGTDYHISVDDYSWYESGEFQLRLNYTSSPSNDSFAKRRLFTDQVTGDLEGGSFEAGEPDFDSSYADSSVWWTWTAPSNGTCRFQLNYASYHLDLALFTGDALDQLELLPGDFPCSGSCAFVKVSAGSNYLLRIVGPAQSSPYTLTATFMAPPANDNFANRIALPGAPFSVTGSNHTATAEPEEPAHHTSLANRSVWWSWTAPASGAVQIILVPYSEMRVAVYTGDSLAALQPLTSSLGTASFNAAQGTTYQIAIDTAWWNTEGHEEFTWHLGFGEPASAPSNTSGGLVVQRPALPPVPPMIQWSVRAITPTNATRTVRQIIETSTNLVDWIPYTNAPANPAELRIVPSPDEPHRFFRVR